MKYKCENCGCVFDEPNIRKYSETTEYWGVVETRTLEEELCPECNDEDIREYNEEDEEEECQDD